MKKSKLTKLYSAFIALVAFFAITTVAFGAVVNWDGIINYYSHSYGYQHLTQPLVKSDNSSAIAAYDSGPAEYLYVQIQGSQLSGQGYVNLTLKPGTGVEIVDYIKIPLEQAGIIRNWVYEEFDASAFARLKVYVYGQGSVLGRWSETTD